MSRRAGKLLNFPRAAFVVAALLAGGAAAGRAQAVSSTADQLHVGDRVALTIEGPFTFADTVVVRQGDIIRIPSLGDINVAGVRRADAQQYLTQQVAKYVKNPVVHATPLVHIAVLGQVGRPGFYSVPSDMPLSDVVMHAGGPTADADLSKTEIKRGGTVVFGTKDTQQALSAGTTLDQLQVAAGDELVVGQKSHISYLAILSVIVPLIGLLYAVSHR